MRGGSKRSSSLSVCAHRTYSSVASIESVATSGRAKLLSEAEDKSSTHVERDVEHDINKLYITD
jgi:hypothetical protein